MKSESISGLGQKGNHDLQQDFAPDYELMPGGK